MTASAGEGVGSIYARLPWTLGIVPLVLVLPFAAELAQHAAEIALGMYRAGRLAAAGNAPQRVAFGVIKVLALLLTMLFLLRFYAFAGDRRRVLRPGRLFFRGVASYVAIGLAGGVVVAMIGRAIGRLAGSGASAGVRIALTTLPLLGWFLLLGLLLPWFVGMIVEDRSMKARRSIGASASRPWVPFGLLIAGVMPAMIVHYALGYGAVGKAPEMVWAMMIADAALVSLMTVLLASTFFTIYRRAASGEQS